ncbi:MAG TPA: hypothetical protein VH331_02115 [Allosphingosinicella sp.]|jgi:hypothetical protein|nr:hypothetical protein [Allosphingosinicella sp.]
MLSLFVGSLFVTTPADALCSGETVQREFAEADLVIRARLASQISAWDDYPSRSFQRKWGPPSSAASLYGWRVLDVFKGRPGRRVNLFQYHDSGEFPVEIDKDYLLFLLYIPPRRDRPTAARGATYVRYACGQSKRWDEVRPEVLVQVRRLAAESRERRQPRTPANPHRH